jgi:signal transduction histidine kinase
VNIRARLTLLFLLLVGSILLLFSLSIYLLYNQYREIDFFDRLREKAITTARVHEDVGEAVRTNLPFMVNEQVRIYEPNGHVIFTLSDGYSPVVSAERLRQVYAGRELQLSDEQAETIGVPYVSRAGQRLVIVASAYDRYGYSKLARLREILLFGWLASLVAVGIAGWLFASDALRPVSDIIEQVNSISGSNIHQRLRVSRQRDELAELAQTFNDMLTRLEEAFVSQRSFVSHASHELRTPLAIMRGNLDVALMQPRSTVYYEQTLNEVLDEVKRMIDLANGLLDLARVSSEAAQMSFQPTRLDETLWQARANLLHKRPDYSVDIDFDNLPEQDEDLTIPGEETLLRTAFQNLMENGCKYSMTHTMRVGISFTASTIQLTFRDNGYGIPATDLPHLFEPFYRSSHTTSKAAGHGIGLALTQRIIQLHRGSMSVESEEDWGTIVQVQFPMVVSKVVQVV